MNMVRILCWEIKRIGSDCKNCICHVCGFRIMREYRGVEVCTGCERKPEVFRCLDLEYWREHPDRVPPCKHCGKAVPPEQLEHVLCDDWYLCPACASNREVLRYYDELRLEMSR